MMMIMMIMMMRRILVLGVYNLPTHAAKHNVMQAIHLIFQFLTLSLGVVLEGTSSFILMEAKGSLHSFIRCRSGIMSLNVERQRW